MYAGFILAILFTGALIGLIGLSIAQIKYKNILKVNLLTFVKGLNIKKIKFPILYFFHFLFIRFALAILIAYQNQADGWVRVWMGVAGIQTAFLIVHTQRLYEKLVHQVLVIVRELQLIFSVVFIAMLLTRD